jgi:hypothetical protein
MTPALKLIIKSAKMAARLLIASKEHAHAAH